MLLDRRTIFVKERVAVMKLRDTYDLLDPESGTTLGVVKDETSGWARWSRLLVQKILLPATFNVYEQEAMPPVLVIRKRPGFWHANVRVYDQRGSEIGFFKSKLFTLGGGFYIHDTSGQRIAEVKGDWKGWNFTFLSNGNELGVITKKWAGIGREFFTTADQYVIALSDTAPSAPNLAGLLLAAALAIDVVFKEKQ
jgi:uncharacterized protein YxjI